MPPSKSSVIVASAGSGKTTWIVNDVLEHAGRVAIVSYTNNNTQKVREKFIEKGHSVPERVTVETWLGFMLRDLVRPYQSFAREERIGAPVFVTGRSARYAKKDTTQYYFDSMGRLYSDKIPEFALLCNRLSNGLVFDRLKALYARIYIDEVQDLAGYDLELLEAAMKAGVELRMVGDNRQATYQTNNSPKNSAFRGPNIIKKFRTWEKAGLCSVAHQAWSHRCNQDICDLADSLFPDFERAESKSTRTSSHVGLFLVEKRLLDRYVATHRPRVLVHSKRTATGGHDGLNFGDSKGLEFPHVVVFPTGPITKWLKSGDATVIDSDVSRAKLYVAITRAMHSVAFVFDGASPLPGVRRLTDDDLP